MCPPTFVDLLEVSLGALKVRNFETLKLWEFETFKLSNFQTFKLWSFETLKLQIFEAIFQGRESPAPLNIPTPTPAPDQPLVGHEGAWGTRLVGASYSAGLVLYRPSRRSVLQFENRGWKMISLWKSWPLILWLWWSQILNLLLEIR